MPAAIVLVRVEAASPPADEPTSVPIDRTIAATNTVIADVTSQQASYIYTASFCNAVHSLSREIVWKSSWQTGIWGIALVAASCVHQA